MLSLLAQHKYLSLLHNTVQNNQIVQRNRSQKKRLENDNLNTVQQIEETLEDHKRTTSKIHSPHIHTTETQL